MLRVSLFSFAMCLMIVVGSIYRARQANFEEFMLVHHNHVSNQQLSAIDPETGTRLTIGDSSYQMLVYAGKNDDAIYFIARSNVIEPRKLYRVSRTHLHPQTIISDIASPEFIQFSWEKEKIIYVRETGELASVNLDGTANQNIPLPEDIRVWRNAQRAFRVFGNTDSLIFSGLQAGNADLFRINFDGSELENITASLAAPHQCSQYYEINTITMIQCDDILYYRRANQANFYELLPKTVSSNQEFLWWSDDDEIQIRDGKLGTIYVVNLASSDRVLPYSKLDDAQPRTSIDYGDWQIMQKQTEAGFELWHVAKDGTETLLLTTQGFPMIMGWGEHLVLLIDIDFVGSAMNSDFYTLSEEGKNLTHLIHFDAYLADLRLYQPTNVFYFVLGNAPPPNADEYQLKGLNPDGSVRTSIDWESRTRIIGWTDIFVRQWSAIKLLIVNMFVWLLLGAFLYKPLMKPISTDHI